MQLFGRIISAKGQLQLEGLWPIGTKQNRKWRVLGTVHTADSRAPLLQVAKRCKITIVASPCAS